MANIPAGKSDIKLRMKDSSIETLKILSAQAGYPTHNLFAVELLEGCLQYLANSEQMRMPDILLQLRQKFSLSQLSEVATRVKKTPDERETLERLINTIVDQRLAAAIERRGKK